MNIREMEENGTIDYYLDLKKYIETFVKRNYPLSKDDIRSIINDNPTSNAIKRQEVWEILNEAMQESLKNVAVKNDEIENRANEGNYTEFSRQNYEQEIFQIKQEMLEKLFIAQHREEQTQETQPTIQQNDFEERTDVTQGETNGEQILEEVIEQSEEMDIRIDEINEANIEINQVERNYIQEQQQPQQDVGMSMGE